MKPDKREATPNSIKGTFQASLDKCHGYAGGRLTGRRTTEGLCNIHHVHYHCLYSVSFALNLQQDTVEGHRNTILNLGIDEHLY